MSEPKRSKEISFSASLPSYKREEEQNIFMREPLDADQQRIMLERSREFWDTFPLEDLQPVIHGEPQSEAVEAQRKRNQKFLEDKIKAYEEASRAVE